MGWTSNSPFGFDCREILIGSVTNSQGERSVLDHAGQSSHESTTSDQGGKRRDRAKGATQLTVAVLPSVLVVLALLVATGSPRLAPKGLLSDPQQILLWILVGAVAALHRPLAAMASPDAKGGDAATLGLGAVVLPAVMVELGSVPAALVAGTALLLSEAFLQGLAARTSGTDNALGRLLPSLERAVLLALAVLLTGTFVSLPKIADSKPPVLALLSSLFFVSILAGTVLSLEKLRKKTPAPRRVLVPMILDGVGWTAGWMLSALLYDGESLNGRWVWWMVALLCAEAARNAVLRGLSDHRVGHFERMRQAHERILSETSGMGDIAQQVLVECRNILPVQWFQFELPEDDDLDTGPQGDFWQSWAAGPDGLLVEGRPKPPSRPSMLPGIHRRASWRIVERQLIRINPDDGEVLLARLRLWCDPRRMEPGAEELLDTLVPQMASSVHRAMLDREAKLDPLTGVPVRRVLESRMQRAYRRCMEDGVPMAVIMCDIDFFKKVNDTYGHAAGDEALKLVAATLDTQRRDNDLCCRYGGEEFTILLERTHGDDALRLAERLRRAVELLHFEFDGLHIPLTMSLGVASFPELHIKTVSELLLLADEALYEAKERGRNQCMLHIGNGAFRPATGARRQESSTIIPRPAF